MSLAVQVTNPYVDGMTLTGAILQSEFSTLIAKVNNLDNDNLNAAAGILMTKTEMGAAARSANAVGLKNTIKLHFQNSSNVDSASLVQDASNNLVVRNATGDYYFKDRGDVNRLFLNAATGGDSILRLYRDNGTDYGHWAYESATDAFYLRTNTKNIVVAPNGNLYIVNTIFPNANNSYNIGSAGNHHTDIFGQNAYTTVSDETQKQDIMDADLGLEFILSLKPKKYKWKSTKKEVVGDDGKNTLVEKNDDEKRYHYGLLAGDVKSALGQKDFAGYVDAGEEGKALRYGEFTAPIIKAIQELSQQVNQLQAKA